VITHFEAKAYGPIKHATCELSPVHAFIGPNDSGKSSLLRALVTAVNSAVGKAPQYLIGAPELSIASGSTKITISLLSGHVMSFDGVNNRMGNVTLQMARAVGIEHGARLVRFDADALREPSPLTTEEEAFAYVDGRGTGLPGVYDLLHNRNEHILEKLSDEMRALFPTVKRLRLLTVGPAQKRVAVDLQDGTTVGAEALSEGMLYYLAFAALRYLKQASLIAVEEPETGLHPARIGELMRIFRDISKSGTQVVIATHSPFVVNELQPHEVSVVTRTVAAGTQVKLISQTPNLEKRSKVYSLGELWVSYANGVDEAPLLNGDQT
jgi:predicted ATPase